jgi:hypothetical protein
MQSPPPAYRQNLTGYDEEHLVTYLRLLDADAKWRRVNLSVPIGINEP